MTDNALRQLVVDDRVLESDVVGGALRPYVSFSSGGEIIPLAGFELLGVQEKVVAVYLACWAVHRMDMRESAAASPAQVSETAGLSGGTVRPAIQTLVKRGLLRGKRGSYGIPTSQVRRACALLKVNSPNAQGPEEQR